MKLKGTVLSILVFLSISTGISAQNNDLNIFGYYQANYTNFNVIVDGEETMDVSSFLMQQMNVFFQKNFNSEFSSFVNLEFTNSFSSQDTIGGFKIQEAWFKYSPSSEFNVKAGVLIPRFNNFNEIKNRTVLLPYLYRPIAYETYFFSQYGTGEFVPTSANLQVYGEFALSDAYLNYAVYYGNSETSLLNNNSNFWGPGQDPTPFKLYGARLGAEYKGLQLGVSMTYDQKNLETYNNGFSVGELGIGYVPRTRLGAYLNYSLHGFELEAELIKVSYDLSNDKKDSLAANPLNPQEFDKTFYHANLLYNINSDLSVYVGYNYLQGEDNFFISEGTKIYNFGASYRVISPILLKAQYAHQEFELVGSEGTRNDYIVGASVSF
jgi:hypothetical protein